jgi:hypothetical protein
VYLLQNSLFLGLGEVGGVPFSESGAAVTTDEKETMDHL